MSPSFRESFDGKEPLLSNYREDIIITVILATVHYVLLTLEYIILFINKQSKVIIFPYHHLAAIVSNYKDIKFPVISLRAVDSKYNKNYHTKCIQSFAGCLTQFYYFLFV